MTSGGSMVSRWPLLVDGGDPGIEQFLNAWWEMKGGADLPTYLAAVAERDTLLRQWLAFLETYPVIVMPSCPEIAAPVNVDLDGATGAARMLDALRFQFVLPVLGLPGLAVPTAPVNGLPMGVQVVSRRFREDLCLDAGEIIEAHLGTCTPIDPQF